MEIQGLPGPRSENAAMGSSYRTGHSGPLTSPLASTGILRSSQDSHDRKARSARFDNGDGDGECYVEIMLEVGNDTVSVHGISGGPLGDRQETALLASRLELKASSLGSLLSIRRLRHVSQELRRMASTSSSSRGFNKMDRSKSGAARALRGMQFMTKKAGTGEWSEVESRFDKLAVNGALPRSMFGQCIGSCNCLQAKIS